MRPSGRKPRTRNPLSTHRIVKISNTFTDVPPKQGLDTEKPRLELGGHVYEGRYEELLGTALIFEKDETASRNVAVTKTSLKLIFTAIQPRHDGG